LFDVSLVQKNSSVQECDATEDDRITKAD